MYSEWVGGRPLFLRGTNICYQHPADAVATDSPNGVRKVTMYWKTRQEVVSYEDRSRSLKLVKHQ